jgi:CheY-like chemotaxis protein
MNRNFIVVDDDHINNLVCRKIITNTFPDSDVQAFTDPESALAYITATYGNTKDRNVILFLDINMPTLTGWDFLEAFARFDTQVKEQLKIYMLSSSVDHRDKDRAAKNKNVCGFIEKPLSKEWLCKM